MFHIYKNEGLQAIYKGLLKNLKYKGLIMAALREASYGTTRLSLYEPIK